MSFGASRIFLFPVLVLVLCCFRATGGDSNISSSSYSSGGSDGYFAICLAVKDDDGDLLEWVEYHRRMGASRFYVFDNNSKPPLNTSLARYIATGLVQYTYMEGIFRPSPQNYIYDQCVKRFNKRHTWMGFIDVDEFLVPEQPGTSVPDILQRYEHFGGLAVNWQVSCCVGFSFFSLFLSTIKLPICISRCLPALLLLPIMCAACCCQCCLLLFSLLFPQRLGSHY
jgi:hypothetical protein